MKRRMRYVVGSVAVVAVAAIAAVAVVAARIPNETRIELVMKNDACRSKVKHKTIVGQTGGDLYWRVTNDCKDASEHLVEVRFQDDPCAAGAVLSARVPANGGTVVLTCRVAHNPGPYGWVWSEYDVVGDAVADDPDVLIRGKDGLLGRIAALLQRFFQNLFR